MSASVGQARLKDAAKQLAMRWDRVKAEWNDDAARDLETEFIQPMPSKINAALGAMGRLGELISAVKRDCE